MAHKGKATSDVSFNLEDPPEAYTNPSVHSRISEYTEVARSLHGLDHDLSTQDIDGEAVIRSGQGNVRRLLQPGGPARGIHEPERLLPHQRVH